MSAQDNLGPQFSVHAGKYAISADPKAWNMVDAWTLTPDGKPDTSALEHRVGWLGFDSGGTVENVHVREGHRRQGIATAMLSHAQSENPDLKFEHSSNLTADGKSWARSRPL